MASEARSGSGKEALTIEKLEAEIDRLKLALEEALGKGEDMLRGEAEDIRERFQQGADELEEHIEAHPVRSALIALAVGFALGRLFTR